MPLYVAFSGGSRFSHALDLDRQHDHCMSVSAQDLIVIGDKRAVATAASAALAWLIWDTIIHIEIEVVCIWRRPKSWVKLAYFFIRYVTILHEGAVFTIDGPAHFSTTGCRAWLTYELVYMEVLTFVVEVILVMRIYVLYNHNRVVLGAMITLFIAEIALMITVLGIELKRIMFTPDCLVASAPSFFMAYWLSSLAFETFLFLLTIIVFFENVKREHGRHSVVHVFVRDGTWAFALIFITLLLNTLMYRLNTNPLAGMGYYWGLSVMSFSGSHVLLNIRRLGIPKYPDMATLPTLQFHSQSGPADITFTSTGETFPESDATDLTAADTFEMKDIIVAVQPHLDVDFGVNSH